MESGSLILPTGRMPQERWPRHFCSSPFAVDSLAGYEIVYAVITFMLIGKTNYLLHLHIHRPFSRKPVFNLMLDLSMGAVTGMVSSNWRIQHLYGHHCGVDWPYRGDRGAREDY
jgi:fatty acid desaturase